MIIYKDRYVLKDKIGGGGQSQVYKIDDLKTTDNKIKVIKKYNKNDQTIQKEISILHKENFNCAFIIKCFDSFTTQLDFFAVFEYHQNGDLANVIKKAKDKNEHIPSGDIFKWSVQLLEALHYIHSRKIIHCDIKPSNILLDEHWNAILCDFGIAANTETMTHSKNGGTLNYMSPELYNGDLKEIGQETKMDMWGLGCVVFELVTLQMAFPGDYSKFGEVIKQTPKIPDELKRDDEPFIILIIKKTLVINSKERSSADEILTDIERYYCKKAEDHVDNQQFVQALEYFKKSLYLRRINQEPAEIANILDKIGEVYMNLVAFNVAFDNFKEALDIRRQSLSNDLVKSHQNYGDYYLATGQHDQAKNEYEQALAMSQNLKDKCAIAKSNIKLARFYFTLQDFKNSHVHCSEALKIYQDLYANDQNHDLAEALNCMGDCWTFIGEPRRGLEFNTQSLNMWKRVLNVDRHVCLANVHNSLAMSNFKLGKYQTSWEYFVSSYEMRKILYKDHGDHLDLARSLNNLGNIYDCLNEFESALDFKLKGLQMFKKLYASLEGGVHMDIANSYSSVGVTYDNMNNYNEALKYKLSSIEMLKKLDKNENKRDWAVSYNNLGATYAKMKNFTDALDAYRKSYEIYKNSHADQFDEHIAITLINISFAYYKLGNMDEYYKYKEMAIKIKDYLHDKILLIN